MIDHRIRRMMRETIHKALGGKRHQLFVLDETGALHCRVSKLSATCTKVTRNEGSATEIHHWKIIAKSRQAGRVKATFTFKRLVWRNPDPSDDAGQDRFIWMVQHHENSDEVFGIDCYRERIGLGPFGDQDTCPMGYIVTPAEVPGQTMPPPPITPEHPTTTVWSLP